MGTASPCWRSCHCDQPSSGLGSGFRCPTSAGGNFNMVDDLACGREPRDFGFHDSMPRAAGGAGAETVASHGRQAWQGRLTAPWERQEGENWGGRRRSGGGATAGRGRGGNRQGIGSTMRCTCHQTVQAWAAHGKAHGHMGKGEAPHPTGPRDRKSMGMAWYGLFWYFFPVCFCCVS